MFTKGEWTLSREDVYAYINAPGHEKFARVVWQMRGAQRSPDLEANAHLMRSAKQLYYALEAAMAYIEEGSDEALHELQLTDPKGSLAAARGEGFRVDPKKVLEKAPNLSEYHFGFEQERFIRDYENWQKERREALQR